MACFRCGKSYSSAMLYFDFSIRGITTLITYKKHRARAKQDFYPCTGENTSNTTLKREKRWMQWLQPYASKVKLRLNVCCWYSPHRSFVHSFIQLPAHLHGKMVNTIPSCIRQTAVWCSVLDEWMKRTSQIQLNSHLWAFYLHQSTWLTCQ